MSCQHDYRYAEISHMHLTCWKCEKEISQEDYEELQQARRAGWEQAKRECVEILQDYCKREMAAKGFGKGWQSLAADAIAAMEYGGKAND